MIARRLLVSGRVQGVAFRAHCAEKAHGLGVHGFVRNLRDGRVELVAQGAEADVAALEGWCRDGPTAARVDDVEGFDHSVDARRRGFAIEPTTAAE